jgi:hypothetical protein
MTECVINFFNATRIFIKLKIYYLLEKIKEIKISDKIKEGNFQF